MKQRNDEEGEGVTDGRDTGRRKIIVGGKRAGEKLKSAQRAAV